MTESEQGVLLESLKMHMQTAKEAQFFIYNSLLTFNGILISAFAIIVSIDANKYKPYIFTQLIPSFLSILAILIIIYRIRLGFQCSTIKLFAEICRKNPVLFEQHKKTIEKNSKYETKQNEDNRFIRFLDVIVLITTFFSFLNLFRIIYESNIGSIF